MNVRIPGAPRLAAVRPVPVGPGRPRKVGLIGGAVKSLARAPWLDPSWSFWAHASVFQSIPHMRADRLFDPHPKNVFAVARKNGFKDYYGFLKTCPTPVYMQEHYEDIPASVRYPLELVQQQWPGIPIASTGAMMVALALLEGVTELGLWGIDYQHDSEYEDQRANMELWVGIAIGSGVRVVIPDNSPLCHEPKLIYGYETHSPEQYAKRLADFAAIKKAKGAKGDGFSRSKLQPWTPNGPAITDEVWKSEVAKMTNEAPPAWLGVPVGTQERV